MKSLFSKLNIFVLLVVAFGCNDKELSNLNVTAVKNLYEPLNNKSVVLQSSASASLYFEWEPAKAEDMGMVLYEVVFDREGGDFSNPIYRMASDNNGGYNHATITHKQLNNIAAKADIASGATGKVQWTVYSSKGINEKKAEMTWVLEITRLQGFENVPVDVYITGEGSEAGATVANAQILKSTAAGEFEIYTKLTGGQTYFFTSDRTGSRKFYPEGSVIKEGEQTATAPATGIYKLTLDFTTSSFSMCEVTAVVFIPLWQNEEFLLDYAGNGIWHKVITFP
ncbi:MAG: SusE domain-containing protein, partial [Bacteroidales bacterium]|nr:SusE domain-containing protein [Bacteroidales bacterium]